MCLLFIPKKFDRCKCLSKKFDIYSKIVDSDVGIFVRHPDIVVRYIHSRCRTFPSTFFTVYVCGASILELCSKVWPIDYFSFVWEFRAWRNSWTGRWRWDPWGRRGLAPGKYDIVEVITASSRTTTFLRSMCAASFAHAWVSAPRDAFCPLTFYLKYIVRL
jgi:hypothetical protein